MPQLTVSFSCFRCFCISKDSCQESGLRWFTQICASYPHPHPRIFQKPLKSVQYTGKYGLEGRGLSTIKVISPPVVSWGQCSTCPILHMAGVRHPWLMIPELRCCVIDISKTHLDGSLNSMAASVETVGIFVFRSHGSSLPLPCLMVIITSSEVWLANQVTLTCRDL